MINQVTLKNFGPLSAIDWKGLGSINLIIGGNGSGKTFLLKAMYAAVRTLEAHGRGNERRNEAELLADKLYWTFQQDKIGDLVLKGAEAPLSLDMNLDEGHLAFQFGKDTSKNIQHLTNTVASRTVNSIFLPPKEVLSLQQVILKSRVQDQAFGFDDTYFDLAQVLSTLTSKGKNYDVFAASRKLLKTVLGGKIQFDEHKNAWSFTNQRNQKFEMGVTAEGIKKLGIIDTLLGNRYLTDKSIIFIDEPESALHPKAIEQFMEIIGLLAQRGLQIFIASHSYFVIKKLYLMAQAQKFSLPLLSAQEGQWVQSDLKDGMPDNPIIDESIRLYEQEVELSLG